MLIDARTLPAETSATADVCLIGAGAAGITLAMELMDSGLSVLLLESGGEEPDPEIQDLYRGENVGQPMPTIDRILQPEDLRLRYYGGTTNHWAGACRPLSRLDFDERDDLRISGWPIRYEDVMPYWERAAGWVRITDAEFDPGAWAARLGVPPPPPTTPILETITFQNTFPTSFREVYGADLAAAPADQVTVWQHANVVNLAMDDDRRIAGVDIRTLDGTPLRATAAAYVLATGGIENARILLSSTDRDPNGVGNANDQVGRHFAEHLQVLAGFGVMEVSEAELAGFVGYNTPVPSGRHEGYMHGVKFAWGISDEHVRRETVTSLEIQLVVGPYPAATWLQDTGATVGDVAALLRSEGSQPAGAIYLQGLAEQELDPDSRVLLGDARDALGMRRVHLDWQYGPNDRARVLANLRTMAEELGAAGLGRLQLLPGGVGINPDTSNLEEFLSIYTADPTAIDPTGFPVGIGFHHLCTTRMATDPREGVVDENCRVHGLDNLWIAGSSVFATPGVATPTFTIVALAARLADHLREQFA